MATTTPLSRAARGNAARVAANIRALGHYQGMGKGNSPSSVCIVVNQGLEQDGLPEFYRALGERIGVDLDRGNDGFDVNKIYNWNDNTPTNTVLRVLDEIAADGD